MSSTALSTTSRFPVRRKRPNRPSVDNASRLMASVVRGPVHFAATVKSNYKQLEGGKGLRIGIVPESADKGNHSTVRYSQAHRLWIVSLADPNGFMGLFSDAYHAVGRSMCALGKQEPPPYYVKPSAKAQRMQEQIEKVPDAFVVDIEEGLNDAAQQNLVGQRHQLVSVNAPDWLHLKQMATTNGVRQDLQQNQLVGIGG